MKIDDLKLFTKVVQLGSFTAAANALDLPRANVSRRIGELERYLGTQLFHRTTRSLSLTNKGDAYYQDLQKYSPCLILQTSKPVTKASRSEEKSNLAFCQKPMNLFNPFCLNFRINTRRSNSTFAISTMALLICFSRGWTSRCTAACCLIQTLSRERS